MRLYYFTSAEWGLEALKSQRLKLARIDELNDPFELLSGSLSVRNHRNKFLQFKKDVASKYGLLCFSKDWRNPVVWGHYADRHQGVALELEVIDANLYKVDYEPSRQKLDVTAAIKRGSFQENDIHRLLSTKFKDWGYEQEWRIFAPLALATRKGKKFFQPFDSELSLRGIFLGALCKTTDSEIVDALPKEYEISRKVTRLAFQDFTITSQKRRPDKSLRGNMK